MKVRIKNDALVHAGAIAELALTTKDGAIVRVGSEEFFLGAGEYELFVESSASSFRVTRCPKCGGKLQPSQYTLSYACLKCGCVLTIEQLDAQMEGR